MTAEFGKGLGSELRQRVALGDELQGYPVVAPALSGRRGAVVEYVALMPAATPAVVFLSRQDQLEVGLGLDILFDCLCEARPASAALELGLGPEQWQAASGAYKRARALLLVQRMRVGPLGALLEEHRIFLRLEQFTPFRSGFLKPVHG